METLRILWLNWRDITNPAAGGAELYTHQVALRLARLGHEVTLFTSRYPGASSQELRDGIRIIRAGSKVSVYFKAPKWLRSERNKGTRYEVVVDAVNTLPFLSPLYVRGATIVVLLYQLTGEIFLKQFRRPMGHLLFAMEKHSYLPWCVQRANRVVTLSDSNRRELIEVCNRIIPENVFTIPPGADHDDFKPGPKSAEPLILLMNRLVRYKQPEHLIAAMKEVCSSVAGAKLMMVGTTANSRYTDYLLRLVRLSGLEEQVSFLLTRPFLLDKISLLQRAWVHVLPSLKEGFGISILEAAACGTPTVGYDVPGVRDAIVQGKTGMLVRPGNFPSLASCLTELLTNASKLKTLGEAAETWATRFLWDDTARQFATLMQTP